MTVLPVDPAFAGGGFGKDYQYEVDGDKQHFLIRGRFEGEPLSRTHNYPGGGSAECDDNSGVYPTCGWWQSCVYKGYGDDCPLTYHLGSD